MSTTLGVLLTNLGTPTAPTARAVRHYLREFLSDPRVVEIPQLLWQPILRGFILPLRPRRSAALYQKIWTTAGSPLLVNSRQVTNALQARFAQQTAREVKIVLGMRYGQPSIAQALQELQHAKCSEIIVLPLFPQYAAATTASVFDAIADVFKQWRVVPALRMLTNYHAYPAYIAAIAASVRQHWQLHGADSHLVFSFHGLPQRCVTLGDPYQAQCQTSAQLIAAALELKSTDWSLVFQSRFGRAQWLQPYCDKTLQAMPARGLKKVSVICPGFAVDCLETLEEIAQLNRDLFLQAGGEVFHYIPALNATAAQIRLLETLILSAI